MVGPGQILARNVRELPMDYHHVVTSGDIVFLDAASGDVGSVSIEDVNQAVAGFAYIASEILRLSGLLNEKAVLWNVLWIITERLGFCVHDVHLDDHSILFENHKRLEIRMFDNIVGQHRLSISMREVLMG